MMIFTRAWSFQGAAKMVALVLGLAGTLLFAADASAQRVAPKSGVAAQNAKVKATGQARTKAKASRKVRSWTANGVRFTHQSATRGGKNVFWRRTATRKDGITREVGKAWGSRFDGMRYANGDGKRTTYGRDGSTRYQEFYSKPDANGKVYRWSYLRITHRNGREEIYGKKFEPNGDPIDVHTTIDRRPNGSTTITNIDTRNYSVVGEQPGGRRAPGKSQSIRIVDYDASGKQVSESHTIKNLSTAP